MLMSDSRVRTRFHASQILQSRIFILTDLCGISFLAIEAAHKALAANCTEVNGKHIFVDLSVGGNRDRTYSVFVGNLPAGAEEEDLYEIFTTQVGPIDYIRIVRDQQFKIGKGFAYAKFRVRA